MNFLKIVIIRQKLTNQRPIRQRKNLGILRIVIETPQSRSIRFVQVVDSLVLQYFAFLENVFSKRILNSNEYLHLNVFHQNDSESRNVLDFRFPRLSFQNPQKNDHRLPIPIRTP